VKEFEVILPIKQSWVFRVTAKTKKRAIEIASMGDNLNLLKGEDCEPTCETSWQKKPTARLIDK